MALEKILTDGSETGLTAANKINNNFDTIISEDTTKTVGVGKDFELLHDALRWVETINLTGGGRITLTLDDGVHIIGGDGQLVHTWDHSFYRIINSNLTIKSASDNKNLCTIAMDSFDDGDSWAYFLVSYESTFILNNITFDPTASGYLYPNIRVGNAQGGQFIVINSTIKNYSMYISASENYTFINNSVLDACSSESVIGENASDIYITNTTISNSPMGITTVSVAKLDSVTFTSNTSNTNIPLNEIQYNGSYISDGTGPLSFKG